jgi:glutamine cyclotransferase
MPEQQNETNRRTHSSTAHRAGYTGLLLVFLLALSLGGCAGGDTASISAGATSTQVNATASAADSATESAANSSAESAIDVGVRSTAAGAAEAAANQTPALPPDAHPTSLVTPQLYTYRVVNVYPHDENAFTQGLIVRDGQFLEGTGREGQSTLRRVEIESGEVLESRPLAAEHFGEGITELDGKIYQLTWRSGVGFIYDAATLEPTGQFTYGTEGWGITHDGARLIVSDGTSLLQFWDPATMQPTGGVYVTMFGLPVGQLNELEYIDGAVYANLWQTNLIVRIDPSSGKVTGVVDLGGLLDYAPRPGQQPDVLNGIAYDQATGRLFVTGKLWPAVFEIELLEVSS